MAGGASQYYLDRLGYCLGDCFGAPHLASNSRVIGIRTKVKQAICRSGSGVDDLSAIFQSLSPPHQLN